LLIVHTGRAYPNPERTGELTVLRCGGAHCGVRACAADLNPLEAALEGYAETRFIKRAQRSDIAPQTSKR